MNIKKIEKLAQQWVEAHSHKWSNNNNEVGDNYGSFVEGYKTAEKELQKEISDEKPIRYHCVPKEISDEEIEKYAQQNAFNYYEFITGAKWYREQLKKNESI